jgi:hypothetical protein
LLSKLFSFVFRVLLGSVIKSDLPIFDLSHVRLRWASPSISGLCESASSSEFLNSQNFSKESQDPCSAARRKRLLVDRAAYLHSFHASVS